MKKRLLSTAYTSGFMLLGAAYTMAATINWGASFNTNDFFSDGSSLGESTATATSVTFEFGAFNVGFTPTAENVADWAANWSVFDTSDYNLLGLPDGSTGGNYGGSVDQSNFDSPLSGVPGVAGQALFIWAFNQRDIDASTQYALIGAQDGTSTLSNSNWVIPTGPSSQGQPAIDAEPFGATAIFGATSNSTGGGFTSSPQVLVDNQIQLFNVIPEPSSVVLFMLGGVALLRRKR